MNIFWLPIFCCYFCCGCFYRCCCCCSYHHCFCFFFLLVDCTTIEIWQGSVLLSLFLFFMLLLLFVCSFSLLILVKVVFSPGSQTWRSQSTCGQVSSRRSSPSEESRELKSLEMEINIGFAFWCFTFHISIANKICHLPERSLKRPKC